MAAVTRTRSRARAPLSLTAVVAACALALAPSTAHAAIGTPVPLGAGASFVVLAGAGVTNTGATTLGGDAGSFPTTSITGGGTITYVGGVERGGDAVTQQAKTDLVTAYNAASAQTPDPLAAVELAGLTLEPGVYDTGGVIELNGNLTLDANGDPNAVFVFQSLSTLLAGAASSITFIDGATACNLYWRVPSSATILAGSQFAGTILAETTISFEAGATLQGRALAQTGEVTLINNTITLPVCSATTPVPTPVPPVTPPAAAPGTGTAAVPSAVAGAATPTAPQVAVRPRGGVATGDGSSIVGATSATTGPDRTVLVLSAAGGLAGLVGVAVLAARTRRT